MQDEEKPQTYKTPLYQLLRQIIMLALTLAIALLSTFTNTLLTKVNDNMQNLETQLKTTPIIR